MRSCQAGYTSMAISCLTDIYEAIAHFIYSVFRLNTFLCGSY